MQYLYLIKCQQFYKIGVANDVQSRLAQLSTGNPFELEVLAVFGFENSESVERALHQRFANTRTRGEWFALAQNDVDNLCEICALLGGEKDIQGLPTVSQQEIEEAEVLALPTDGGKWDFAAMFSDGWCMVPSNSKEKRFYWVWRKRRVGEPIGYIYGGRIVDLPYPLDEMRRIFGGKDSE